MKKQITRISLLQTAKVFALLTFITMAIVSFSAGILSLLSNDTKAASLFFIMPFIYGVFSYFWWLLIGWIYNLIAKHFGGIEFTLEDQTEPLDKKHLD